MPTCRDIITRALRKAKIISSGEIPTADETADGMDELVNLYEQWATNGMFGRLADVLTDGDYEASPGERIRVTAAATITIPETVEDGEFPPYDMAFIEVIDVPGETITRHLYDAGAWINLSTLTLDDEAPLAGKGRGGLSACLALSLAEEFGREITAAVVRQASSFKMGLSLKLGSDAQRTAPDYF